MANESPNVSTRTIRRYLNRSDYSKKTPKRKSMLNAQHKGNRVKWCLAHQNTRWCRWVFSDESKFQLFANKNKRWLKEIPRICTPKFGKSLMAWEPSARKKNKNWFSSRGLWTVKCIKTFYRKLSKVSGNFTQIISYFIYMVLHVTP